MNKNYNKNGQLAKNSLYMYVRMFFVLVVSLYTSRIVLNTLGVVDYGIYNVVAGFVSMFAFLNTTLSSSIQRFYNVELGECDDVGMKNVYTTGLFIQLILSVVLMLLLETIGVWYINNELIVPQERLFAANMVFQSATISTIIVVLEVPYSGAIIAYERMDYYAVVSILNVMLKLGLVLWLPNVPYDKLIVYSILMVCITSIDFLLYFFYSKKKFKLLKRQNYVDKSLLKSLLSFSGWNLVGTFAFMLKGQGINLLLNVFFGPIVNAARGISTQVRGAMSNFTGAISISFRPQIIQSYSEGNRKRTQELMYFQSKICFALIGALIVPIILQIDNVLNVWLGENVPPNTSLFTALVLIETLIGNLNPPCTAVVHAVGNLKKYQICSTIIHCMVIPCAWLFLKLGFGPESSFVVCIAITVLNQLSCSVIACNLCGFPFSGYIKNVLLPCGVYIMVLPVVPCIVSICCEKTVLHLIMIFFISLVVAIPTVFFILLNGDERLQTKKAICKILYKIRKVICPR